MQNHDIPLPFYENGIPTLQFPSQLPKGVNIQLHPPIKTRYDKGRNNQNFLPPTQNNWNNDPSKNNQKQPTPYRQNRRPRRCYKCNETDIHDWSTCQRNKQAHIAQIEESDPTQIEQKN